MWFLVFSYRRIPFSLGEPEASNPFSLLIDKRPLLRKHEFGNRYALWVGSL
jgi:hypothetical protein